MLIRTSNSIANGVYSTSVAVEFSSLETAYAKAYGEPQIDLAGVIPFTPAGEVTSPSERELDVEQDIGTPPVSGGAASNAGIDGIELTGSGTFPELLEDTVGFFKGVEEVVGDFTFVSKILYVDEGLPDVPGVDPTIVDGFRVGMMVQYGTASDAPGVIFGWGSHRSSFNLALWARPTAGAPYAEVNAVARSSATGLMLKLVRESLTLTASYSVDGGETWTIFSSTTLPQQTYRVGLFANSGTAGEIKALVSDILLTTTPVVDPNSFTIAGGPRLAYMRSGSPHLFRLDGRLDPEAEAKVAGWADTIKNRLTVAKALLVAQASPIGGGDSVVQA